MVCIFAISKRVPLASKLKQLKTLREYIIHQEQHKNVVLGHSPKQLRSEISPVDRIQLTESPNDVQNLLLRLQVQLCHTHNT